MISDQLRAAIEAQDKTLYRIAKDLGLPYSTLYDFYCGRTDAMKLADRLAEYLGLAVTPEDTAAD